MATRPLVMRTTALGLAALLVVLDQLSKWWILALLGEPGRVIEVLPFFNLVLVANCGISFGLFGSCLWWLTWLLIAVSAIIVVVLLFWLKGARSWIVALAIGAVIGGAVGNIIDRLLPARRAVVDFLDFHAFGVHWPAFNVADSAIVLGVIALLLGNILPARGQVKAPGNVD